MGSVIDYIDCPNCGQEAYDDFYYKTGEEYVNCSHCGYHYSSTIINRDKRLDELTEEDWEIKECKEPYGAYRIKHYDSVGYQMGTLETETEYSNIKEWVEKELNDVEYFSVSRLVGDDIVKEIVIDNGPKTDSAGYTDEDR